VRPHLADANEFCIQEIGVVHVAVATRSSSYRRFCACDVHFWPTKKAYILVVVVIATSLKENEKVLWRAAVNKLRSSKPINIQKGLRDPY